VASYPWSWIADSSAGVSSPAMAHHSLGPRRSDSVESYLRETRIGALVAVIALVGGVVSDEVGGHFWERHALVAGLVASLVVVMLSVAVVNEAIELRRSRRWTVLAQYVMLELTRNARVIWTGVAELAGLMPSDSRTAAVLDAGSRVVRDTRRLTDAVGGLVKDPERRRLLHEGFGRFVSDGDEMLGRWAAVMLNVDAYAEIIDRHVELALEVSWLDSLLDASDPPAEHDNSQGNSRSHPAVQVEGQIDDDRLVTRVVAITQLAADLDRLTLQLALRLVPVKWWAERLGTTPAVWSADPQTRSAERAAL
jgi:hypothetical protein